jgi:hypothetical protein
MLDQNAIEYLSHTVKLDTLSFPGDFDALFMPGGHGAYVDFVDNPPLKAAIGWQNCGQHLWTVFTDSEVDTVGKTHLALVQYLPKPSLRSLEFWRQIGTGR